MSYSIEFTGRPLRRDDLTFSVGRNAPPDPVTGAPGGKGGSMIFQAAGAAEEVVRFTSDGDTIVNPRFAAPEAARRFWEAVHAFRQRNVVWEDDKKEIARLNAVAVAGIEMDKDRAAEIARLRKALEAAKLGPACETCDGKGSTTCDDGGGYTCDVTCGHCGGLNRDAHDDAIDEALKGG